MPLSESPKRFLKNKFSLVKFEISNGLTWQQSFIKIAHPLTVKVVQSLIMKLCASWFLERSMIPCRGFEDLPAMMLSCEFQCSSIWISAIWAPILSLVFTRQGLEMSLCHKQAHFISRMIHEENTTSCFSSRLDIQFHYFCVFLS